MRSLTLIDTATAFAEPGWTAMRDRAGAARQGGMQEWLVKVKVDGVVARMSHDQRSISDRYVPQREHAYC